MTQIQKRKQKAKETGCTGSMVKRYRNHVNMDSPSDRSQEKRKNLQFTPLNSTNLKGVLLPKTKMEKMKKNFWMKFFD